VLVRPVLLATPITDSICEQAFSNPAAHTINANAKQRFTKGPSA
jgi:hypothetical protein